MSYIESVSEPITINGGLDIDRETEGVELRSFAPYDTVKVSTRNNDYEIFLLDPESGRALIHGGHYFAQPTEATVIGSTLGGCMIKTGWIGVGLRMEILTEGKFVRTSPVQAVAISRGSEAAAF